MSDSELNFAFPYGLDSRGRTATSDEEAHLRGLIELLLFTQPGERLHQPDLGTPIRQLLFSAGSEEHAMVQHMVSSALQRELGDRLAVESVQVEALEGGVAVTVRWVSVRTGAQQQARFTGGGA